MNRDVDDLAEAYVRVALALGIHDPDYVDAYYGPADWRADASDERLGLRQVAARAQSLIDGLEAVAPVTGSADDRRRTHLLGQVRALVTRAQMLAGAVLGFDEESVALYGASAPTLPEQHFSRAVGELDALLPGRGRIAERHKSYAARYTVPHSRLADAFGVAIGECRRRTLGRMALPTAERFDLEYVTGYTWGAQNWYQGGYRSRILVNTDVPLRIERVLDLACHEGYPGHHVASLIAEHDLVGQRGQIEFTIFPLYSPMALTLEGTAMLAVDVAFPEEERIAFERDVVYPAAGLDPAGAEQYDRVRKLVDHLSCAVTEAARGYLDGSMTTDEATGWLVEYALMAPEQARQRLEFIQHYRSYVINYTVGRDVVRRHLEGQGGTADCPDRRWLLFEDLLRSPSAVAA